MTEIAAVNIRERWALLTDGRTVPVTGLFDLYGEETFDPDAAVAFVAGCEGQWFAGSLTAFAGVSVH